MEPKVAPLTGSVDRNQQADGQDRLPSVAPLTGSVDRNSLKILFPAVHDGSLPSRGAWIEIPQIHPTGQNRRVAPLTGSVDRNKTSVTLQAVASVSRSPHGERG